MGVYKTRVYKIQRERSGGKLAGWQPPWVTTEEIREVQDRSVQ